MSAKIPPRLALENVRVAELVHYPKRNVIMPKYQGWLNSERTTKSGKIFEFVTGKNRYYTVLTGKQTDERFLAVLDCDKQRLTDWARRELPKTFTVKTTRGAHFYFWLSEEIEPFNIIKLLDGKEAVGELLGNRCSARGANSEIPTLNKKYIAEDGKAVITILTKNYFEKLTSAFTVKTKTKAKQKPNEPQSELIEEIKRRVKISALLEKAGIRARAGKALCFMHNDKNPSLSYNDEQGLWNCFVCVKGGNVFTLYKELRERGIKIK